PSPHLFPYTTLFRSRLDLHQRLPALDPVADGDEPLQHRALLHRVGQAGHDDVDGHQRSRKVASTAWMTCSSWGNAACSSGREYRSEEHTSELQSRAN